MITDDEKTKAMDWALKYLSVDRFDSHENAMEFLSDFWNKSRDAALKEAEKDIEAHNEQGMIVISKSLLLLTFKRLRGVKE